MDLPLDPARRHWRQWRHTVAATRAGYGRGRRGALAAASVTLGIILGTLRVNARGDRWIDLKARGTLPRQLAGAAPLVVVLGGSAGIAAAEVLIRLPAAPRRVLEAAGIAVVTAVAALVVRQAIRIRRNPLPPPQPNCVWVGDLAAAANADPWSLVAMRAAITTWLDRHNYPLRFAARGELAPVYERVLDMEVIGRRPAWFGNELVTVLERRPRPADRRPR
jgi:hypothetical protein